MRRHPLDNRRGMALLMTLAVITVLVAFTLELNRRVRSSLQLIAAARDRAELSQMAGSGVHAGMALLAKDRLDSETDSLGEDWADGDVLADLMEAFPFERGKVSVRIGDELGKIQVNAVVKFPDRNDPNDAQMFFWDRFLTRFVEENDLPEDIDPREIVHSLKDWIDSGDDDAITGLTGAESGYYLGLDPPYACRNGPMPDLSDLLRVKGVTRELFHGGGDAPGIAEYLTVHGMSRPEGGGIAYPGRVNIGTAPLPVLRGLVPLEYEDLAEAIYDYREEMAADLETAELASPQWYRNVPGFGILDGGNLEDFEALTTTASDLFRILSTAEMDGSRLAVEAVVQRLQDRETGKWRCDVLSWRLL